MNNSYRRNTYRFAAGWALIALAGCASAPSTHRVSQSREPLQRIELRQPPTKQDALTLALAGEFALADADLQSAADNYVKAAQASDDPAIAAQATRVAIAAKRWDAANATFERWQAEQPNDPGVWQAHAMIELHEGSTQAAYDDLAKLAQQPEGKGWRLIAPALVDAADKKQASEMLERLATPPSLGAKAGNVDRGESARIAAWATNRWPIRSRKAR